MSKLARVVNPKQIKAQLPKTRFALRLFPTAMNVRMRPPAKSVQMGLSSILAIVPAGLRFAMPKMLQLRRPRVVKTNSSSLVTIANVLELLRPRLLFSL